MAWVIKCVLHTNLLKLNKFSLKYDTFQESRLVVEGGIGIFGFAVLAIFYIGFSVFRFWWSLQFADFSFFSIWFSVFVKNTSGFSVLVPDVVFGFWKGSEVQ